MYCLVHIDIINWCIFDVYKHLYSIPQETEAEIEDEVDILMSSDIVAAQMSTKQITFSRAQTGWIFRADKKVCVMLSRFILDVVM